MFKKVNPFEEIYSKPGAEPGVIAVDIRHFNIFRSLVITFIAIFISSSIIFTNHDIEVVGTPFHVFWQHADLVLNEIVLVIFVVLALFAAFIFKYKMSQTAWTDVFTQLVFIVVTLWGALGSVADQEISSSIVSLLIVCVSMSISLMVKPWKAILIFGVAYLLFYVGSGYTQSNLQVLSFNRSAAFWSVCVSAALSIFFWKNNVTRITQSKIIDKQKKELENNYFKLLQSSEELKTAIATKNKFFSIISHDLRGPLTATYSLTQMMIEVGQDDSPAERDKALKIIDGGLQNILKLLEDLLLWSETQTHTISFRPVQLNLFDATHNSLALLELAAAEKDIELVNEIGPAIFVNADKNMLNTIVRNLLSNAIKFSNPGNKVKLYTQAIHNNGTGNYVSVIVEDNGIGISKKTLDNLFKIEHKITTPGTQKERGTGLGLILCRELIDIHKGFVNVTSQIGVGTRIEVGFFENEKPRGLDKQPDVS